MWLAGLLAGAVLVVVVVVEVALVVVMVIVELSPALNFHLLFDFRSVA